MLRSEAPGKTPIRFLSWSESGLFNIRGHLHRLGVYPKPVSWSDTYDYSDGVLASLFSREDWERIAAALALYNETWSWMNHGRYILSQPYFRGVFGFSPNELGPVGWAYRELKRPLDACEQYGPDYASKLNQIINGRGTQEDLVDTGRWLASRSQDLVQAIFHIERIIATSGGLRLFSLKSASSGSPQMAPPRAITSDDAYHSPSTGDMMGTGIPGGIDGDIGTPF